MVHDLEVKDVTTKCHSEILGHVYMYKTCLTFLQLFGPHDRGIYWFPNICHLYTLMKVEMTMQQLLS